MAKEEKINGMPPFFGNDDGDKISKGGEGRNIIENEDFKTDIDMALPMLMVKGDHNQRAVHPKLEKATTLGDCTPIVDQPADPEENKFFFSTIATQFRTSFTAAQTFNQFNDPLFVQALLGTKRLTYNRQDQLFNGNHTANPNETDGLLTLVAPHRKVDLAGMPATACDLDRLINMISKGNRCMILTGHTVALEILQAAAHAVETELNTEMVKVCCDGTEKCVQFQKWGPVIFFGSDLAPIYTIGFEHKGNGEIPPIDLLKKGVEPIISPPLRCQTVDDVAKLRAQGFLVAADVFALYPNPETGVAWMARETNPDIEVIVNNDINNSKWVVQMKQTFGVVVNADSTLAVLHRAIPMPCVTAFPPPMNGDVDVEKKKKA
jgi:hypothetical protein